jgi:hypothetical protein
MAYKRGALKTAIPAPVEKEKAPKKVAKVANPLFQKRNYLQRGIFVSCFFCRSKSATPRKREREREREKRSLDSCSK